jgi:hypothetical protein
MPKFLFGSRYRTVIVATGLRLEDPAFESQKMQHIIFIRKPIQNSQCSYWAKAEDPAFESRKIVYILFLFVNARTGCVAGRTSCVAGRTCYSVGNGCKAVEVCG